MNRIYIDTRFTDVQDLKKAFEEILSKFSHDIISSEGYLKYEFEYKYSCYKEREQKRDIAINMDFDITKIKNPYRFEQVKGKRCLIIESSKK